MRPVDKGNAPKIYSDYKLARPDLAGVIGYYCSYCEMPVKNMIEVEHVHPQANGGNVTDWNNFLLSCKYCNNAKLNHNQNRNGYLWPDQDNTDLAFDYSEQSVIESKSGLTANQKLYADDTIELIRLNRIPGRAPEPTPADTRWVSRQDAWGEAKKSLNRWNQSPTPVMAEQIAGSAKGFGHYSIWLTVFRGVNIVCAEIEAVFIGTYKVLDLNGNRVVRQNGKI
jgi:uncharacterized protein (TIGR02646 family)